jgi:predicted nucleic acid-binding protein
MASLVLDTSAVTALAKANPEILQIVDSNEFDIIIIPLATDAELRFGYQNGSQESTNLVRYEQMKRDMLAEITLPDLETSKLYAQLATWCTQHGIATSNNDLWIAATAIQNGAQLLTLDTDFSRLPQVRLAKI